MELKLNISPKVERYLTENKIVDDRQIWCYAHMEANMKMREALIKLYGMVLVCVNTDSLLLYYAEFNSADMGLIYSCKISEMQNVRVKKIFFGLRRVLSFSIGEENFKLEMDNWKCFSRIFENT